MGDEETRNTDTQANDGVTLKGQHAEIVRLRAEMEALLKEKTEASKAASLAVTTAVKTALLAQAQLSGLQDLEHLETSRFAVKPEDYYDDKGVKMDAIKRLFDDAKVAKPKWFTATPTKIPAVTETVAGGEASGKAASPEDMIGPINVNELIEDHGNGAAFTIDSYWAACYAKGVDPRENLMKNRLPSRNPYSN